MPQWMISKPKSKSEVKEETCVLSIQTKNSSFSFFKRWKKTNSKEYTKHFKGNIQGTVNEFVQNKKKKDIINHKDWQVDGEDDW